MNRKLNFGCGARYSPGWENIDFYSPGPEVRRVNLVRGFPYPDGSFEAVYSSHVLEHFTKRQCFEMLRECFRVLRPGGVVRVVVPDLGVTIDEYQRIRGMADSDPDKAGRYRWIMIELLDQLVRTERNGEWGRTLRQIDDDAWRPVAGYVRERLQLGSEPVVSPPKTTLRTKLKGFRQKISSRAVYWWLRVVRMLVPSSLRPFVFVNTGVGEKHLWMYDEYGMRTMLSDAGFVDISRMTYDRSAIPGFAEDYLDCNRDGSQYKSLSLYMEARKPT